MLLSIVSSFIARLLLFIHFYTSPTSQSVHFVDSSEVNGVPLSGSRVKKYSSTSVLYDSSSGSYFITCPSSPKAVQIQNSRLLSFEVSNNILHFFTVSDTSASSTIPFDFLVLRRLVSFFLPLHNSYLNSNYIYDDCTRHSSFSSRQKDSTHLSPFVHIDNKKVFYCLDSCFVYQLEGHDISVQPVDIKPSDISSSHGCTIESSYIFNHGLSVIQLDNKEAEYAWKYPYFATRLKSLLDQSPHDNCAISSQALLRESYNRLLADPSFFYSKRYTYDSSLAVYRLHWGLIADTAYSLEVPNVFLLNNLYRDFHPYFSEQPTRYSFEGIEYPYFGFSRFAKFWSSNRLVPNNYVSATVLGLLHAQPSFDLSEYLKPNLSVYNRFKSWFYFLPPNNNGWIDFDSYTKFYYSLPWTRYTPYTYRFFEVKTYLKYLTLYAPGLSDQSLSIFCPVILDHFKQFPGHFDYYDPSSFKYCGLSSAISSIPRSSAVDSSKFYLPYHFLK